ncbi:hypothetical protein BXZ70DRAFT_908781 [Cristinia sonorae]|uniref:polynucleotide adenylyltransferase n=1 Tax=Cristinia sonorae TaxID=1940300 RepID=A0A8K0XMZ5_9AGAR|nr:hypothetical protein BXZ70DRAFT_908781 [Cristinia sonorae]
MSTTLTLTSKHGQPTTASASLALPVDPANTVAVAGQQAKSARVSCKKKKRKLRQLEKDCGVGPDSSLYTRGAWQTPWLDSLGMTEYESMEQSSWGSCVCEPRLHDEIVAYVAYCNATEQEVRARVLVVAKLEQFIRRRVSVCDVQLFGSVALDVCLPDSDIDLVIQTPQVYDDKYKTRVLHQLASMFRFSISCREPTVAVGACVPVLQFKTSPPLGSYDIDISINADDGVKAVPVIKEYLANFPILRPLLLVLKGFLRKLDLHSASNGGLGSYGLSCMTICFLKLIIRKRDEKLTTDFMENESLGVLLMDFLQFYGQELDWTTSCISPAQGEIVTKESLGFRNSTLPEALSIQCLLNPGRDIGRSASRAKQIKAAFSDAFNTLKAYKLSMTKCNVLGTIVRFSYLLIAGSAFGTSSTHMSWKTT